MPVLLCTCVFVCINYVFWVGFTHHEGMPPWVLPLTFLMVQFVVDVSDALRMTQFTDKYRTVLV